MNTLYFGDNLEVLRGKIESNTVDLIYLDPPFQSGKNYNIIFEPKTREAKGISAKLRHLRIPCNDGSKIVGTQKSFERHGKHLFTLRSYRKSLFKTFDGCNFWS